MRSLFVFLVVQSLLVLCPVKAQDLFSLQDSVMLSCKIFTIDALGNLYCLTTEEITKYRGLKTPQWHYSNPRLGAIRSLDVSDPLNVLVYHADFQKPVWLDRHLSEKPLPDAASLLAAETPELICSSAQGGFWVYMPQSAVLKRYNQSLQKEAQSPAFFEILPGFDAPEYMTETSGKLFVSQPDQGVAIFDAFGNLISLIPKKGLTRFQVRENFLIWFSEKELIIFDFAFNEERLFLLPETGIRSGMLIDRKLYLQTDYEIKMFQVAGKLF